MQHELKKLKIIEVIYNITWANKFYFVVFILIQFHMRGKQIVELN